ncbi:hypothetical protein HRG_003492 [Hirsutella rhossiliensis]|uniref:Fermentation associated protein n=1 Tax=Hirsutella rhossiliensis TaxID=111463 RepID=A0A9P8SK13_9HYPO|nr:uncharacterized protein HRG_03492 [Hirsutella rhossiliensis]KAH0965476.1 hypothetical protein HRG_03492 [Hirsutella rhossiliensis]
MSTSNHVINARATGHLAFNFEFPLFLIICALLSIFFLLYFNRVFASVVSYGIRAFTWHRYRVYIDVKALQISLLGGRIFFTGLRYHGSNETFLVQHGSITWRYWLRRVREVDIRASSSTAEGVAARHDKNAALPCRINVKLVGLEWFVYNRSPAYDTIIAGLADSGSPETEFSGVKDDKDDDAVGSRRARRNEPSVDTPVPGIRSCNQGATSEKSTDSRQNSSLLSSSTGAASTDDESQRDGTGLPFILQLFPIHVDCHKPAVVVGNETTKAILVVKANSASTDIDASATPTCDQYRQTFKARLDHPVVEMKENEDFKEDLTARATRRQEDAQGSKPPLPRSFFRRNRRKILSSLRNMVPYWRRSVESFSTDSRTAMGTGTSQVPGSNHWQGLSRYLDDQYQDDKARWSLVEYGAVPTILDSPDVTLTVYWDVVGRVTEQAHLNTRTASSANINGCEPPAWGMSLSVKGGTMSYGPWADRHRANLQRVFFPPLAKNASPASALPAGAWRVATCFTLFVDLEDTVTLRIPTREESKNWRWRGKEPPIRHQSGPSKRKQRNRAKKNIKGEASQPRPAGWLEIKVPANATVAYSMDMLASPSGFENRLDIDLPSTELWSSVNHDLLWKSGAQRISCNLGNPLPWNTLRQWHFSVDCTDLELFLLRDHVFLLIDLVDDWASGPPPEYLVFTPFKYHLHLNLRNPRLYINVNDENIIDNATALDDNAFLILSSPLLNVETTIPLDSYRPSKNAIPFDIRTDSVDLNLHFPQSSTQAAFLPFNELGHADGLVVSGSYQYNSTTSPANTDTLVLKVHGQSPYAHLYGFVVRYFLLLKDNYFGDHVHFRTLDEYQEQLQVETKKQGAEPAPRPPNRKSNDLDVILSVKVDDPRVMLPANLYSADRYVQCELADLSVDLRFTNYFMDLELALSPLSLSMGNPGNGMESPGVSFSSTQLFIDGLRIFGHRTFGLPPSEPTYLCNWDLAVGAVSGECSADFLATLIRAGTAFSFTFDDVENALVPYSSLVFHDITFVRAAVDSVRVWVHLDDVAFLFSTDTIEVKSNDWARSHYSKRADVSIPNVQLSCVNAEAAARHNSRRHHPVETQAYLRTNIHLAAIGRKFHFTKERKIQQDLARREDQRTERIPFLLIDGLASDFVSEPVDPPAQCSPTPPFPVIEAENDGNSSHTEHHYVKDVHDHSSVAFSSQYFAPHFPSDSVRPENRDAVFPDILEDDDDDDIFGQTIATLGEIDPRSLSEEHAYASVILEFPSGLTACIKPEAVRHAVSLLAELQPSEPESILDSLQIGAMGEIFASKKPEHHHGKIQDLLVRLPKADIRFLNSAAPNSPNDSHEDQDQYDLRISKAVLITRTVKESSVTKNARTSLHFRLKSAEISASERLSSLYNPKAAVMVEIDDVMVSLGAKDITFFDADIGSIVGSTASGKIEYLASLIHRTGTLASDLESLVSATTAGNSERAKYLTYRLLNQGRSTNDPAFLTRPSAVLRSAPQHMRTCDSWKLVMRLRQIWATMRTIKSSLLADDCKDASCLAPPDAAGVVLTAFQRWRSWDLEDAANSVLLARVFGGNKAVDVEAGNDAPILGACRLAELRFVLDPGPKQNNIGLLDITFRVEQKPAASNHTPSEVPDFDGPLTVCNLCCSDAAVHLNWELCELADDVLRLYNRNRASSLDEPKSTKPHAEPARARSSAFHVVLELVRGSIDLETVNLSLQTLSSGLKASVLMQSTGEQTDFASALVNCNAVTSRLHSHSQLLGTCQLRQPSIFASHELQETEEALLRSFKSTGSCQDLTFAIKQDPISLLETTDLVIRDEVAQLYRLQSLIPASTNVSEPVKMADRLSKVKINVALFLDSYTINIPLLQSLTYKISGVVARIACAANRGEEVILDFDVKENSHGMQIDVRDEPRSISLLQIPPMNGRVTSQTNQSDQALTILSSIEVIRLDASAIYSILAALNRPQISSAIQEIQQQTKIIRGHMADVFGTTEPPSPAFTHAPRTALTYNLHLTLAGLRIFTKAVLTSKTEPMAQILFSLDKTHLLACNQHDSDGPPLRYPDLHVNLRQMGLDVRRGRKDAMRSCGSMGASVTVSASSRRGDDNKEDWHFNFRSDELDINLSPETVSTVIDVIGYSGSKVKDLDTSRELEYLRKLRQSKPRITINDQEEPGEDADLLGSVLASVVYQFELRNIRMCWDVANESGDKDHSKEDLVLSIQLIEFGTRTRKSARLTIERLLLQTVPPGQDKNMRSLHSALLPEVIFNAAYVSTAEARRMAFQATGESLDLRLTSAFIVPAANLVESISLSMRNVQEASAQWTTGTAAAKKPDETTTAQRQRSFFGNKRLESLLIDADFAGAVVYVSGKDGNDGSHASSKHSRRPSLGGKYGQFNADDSGSAAVLRTPGLAWKAEYRDNGEEDPSLYGEVKIDASSNILYPAVVPLILDIMSSVKEVVSNSSQDKRAPNSEPPKMKPERSAEEDNILTADPSAVLGRLKLNLGLRICRQEFSLSCQPVARVAATMSFDNVYFTVNTVTSQEQGNFFAISGTLTKPQASVQHVYSRDSTASFGVDTVTLSFMNSKHVSGTSGVSAILKVSPMNISVNAKQVQDFLLFREIWYPEDLRHASSAPVAKLETETSQGHLVQRYQQVAATTAFPWTATISIAALDVQVDLGQAIGKSVFQINDFWVSAKKTSDWDQNLCLGFRRISIDCTGRLSGFVALQHFRLRTSIQWPKREQALNETPLIQASLAFNALRVKAAFDYQAFLVADVTSLEFLMYNVRERREGSGDRLVAIFDGDAVQVFGTTASAAQAVALYQAMQKLIQERKENFELSLREIEKFTRRKSNTPRHMQQHSPSAPRLAEDDTMAKSPISLDTDVVVTLKTLNLGVFPSTFSDHQVFKMEALNAYARFAASMEQRRIHSILRMTLGQLRIGLAGVRNAEAPKTLSEMTVEDVVQRSTGSRGGTILKVPRVEAVMETWQSPKSNHIDFVFKSAFEGKVEVGWNYSRISYIRGMWASHSKSLEQTWGRQLPMTAVKITGVPQTEAERKEGEQQKIRAEVNVPQSKYEYVALEPPVIETPQLRDMGEATPPLEWIGLHRDKMPNLTHQIVIVSLLELAGEVEDAYSRILGSS